MGPQHVAVRTADVGEAEDGLARAFPGLRVAVRPGAGVFEFSYRSIVGGRFAVHQMRCDGFVRAAGPLPESVAVGRRLAGEVVISRVGPDVSTARPYLRPIAPTEFLVHDAEVNLVTLQPNGLRDYLERGGEQGSVTARISTGPGLAAWSLVMDHALTFLDDPLALQDPGEEEELHDLLCWSLVRAFPDPWAESRGVAVRSGALRRATQYLEEHADGTVTMPAVAEAARVSLRTLGVLFRRELDTTPHRWLHELRLDRAHRDLVDGATTVSDVALQHGLRHLGRFAADYRRRYGENPRATLRGSSAQGGAASAP